MKIQTEQRTFRVHTEAPTFLLKDIELFNPCLLETDEIDNLIEVQTGAAPKVYDALCADSSSGYEMYDLLLPHPDIDSNTIDNYFAGGGRIYRISGVAITMDRNHFYELEGVKGYFEFSEDTNEEIVFIPLSS